jgi:hypothetical protein
MESFTDSSWEGGSCSCDGNAEVPGGPEPPLGLPGLSVEGGRIWASCGRVGKKNQIRKGEGKDGQPDQYDKYLFVDEWAYGVIRKCADCAPKARQVFDICTLLEQRCRDLSIRNRAAKRRLPNAYCWIDRNKDSIPVEVLSDVVLKYYKKA